MRWMKRREEKVRDGREKREEMKQCSIQRQDRGWMHMV